MRHRMVLPRPTVLNYPNTMAKTDAHLRASRMVLALICQLLALIASTNAQSDLQTTQANPLEACTPAQETDGSLAASVARSPCLSFAPLSTSTAEVTSSLPFSLSALGSSSTLSASTTVPQFVNSTLAEAVSTSTGLHDISRGRPSEWHVYARTRAVHDEWDTLTG